MASNGKVKVSGTVKVWPDADIDELADLDSQDLTIPMLLDSAKNARQKYPLLTLFLEAPLWDGGDGQ